MLSLVLRYLVTTPRSLCPFFKLASGRSSSLHARAVWSTGSPLPSGFALQETNGSPKFPDYPCEYMPRSSTPVVSSILALAYPGLLPSVSMRTSAFPSKLTVILCENISPLHDYTNFEAQSRGLYSCLPWLRTSVTGLTRRVRYQPVG